MRLTFVWLALSWAALGQVPQPGPPPPAEQQAPRGTQQMAPVPKPGDQPVPSPLQGAAQGTSINLNLQNALQRAAQYSQQVYSARTAAQLAREDTVQARSALLPNVTAFSQYIYTQPNGTLSGAFVSNDGPHVYNDQAIVHGEIYNPVKLADYHRIMAAEAVARARADLANRGLVATVTGDYYAMVAAQRKIANARQSLQEALLFLDITQKQQQGGEAAYVDVVKARIQVEQRQREVQDEQTVYEKARIEFAVILFPNYGQPYTVADDLEGAAALPPYAEVQAKARENNPDIRVATATVQQQNFALTSARAAYLPSLSFDYFFGLNANQFAVEDRYGHNNLGSVAQAQVTIPVWTWGANRSRVRQAELQLQQAKNDLSLAQRTLLAEMESLYLEAQTASSQLASLKSTAELSAENLRLTRLRYTAGESAAQEVVDAQTQLAQARNAYDDGLVRYRLALANLQTLTGAF